MGGSNLLSVPIHKLLAEVEELKSQQEAIRQVSPSAHSIGLRC